MKLDRRSDCTPEKCLQGSFSIVRDDAAIKGVFMSKKQLVGIASIFLLCIVVVSMIVYFAKPGCTDVTVTTQPHEVTVHSSTTRPPPIKDLRLPTSVKPIHYSLILAPFIYSNNDSEFYFTGKVSILVRVLNNTANFKLHTNKLAISRPRVTDRNGNNLTVSTVEEDPIRQWQSVTMSEPLQAGQNYTIVVDKFRGPLWRDLCGLYLSSYMEQGVEKYLVASQMQATDARKAFPCFDEPAFKATFDVGIIRHQNFKAASNMPISSTSHVQASDWFGSTAHGPRSFIRVDFQTTPIMSTYLLAVLVSQFDDTFITDSKGRKYVTWARPERANDIQCSKYIARNITSFFEQYFNIEYPLPKIDQAAIPDFSAGAMENWGLIMYREVYLVCDTQIDKSSYLQLAVAIIAHELGHMWFGNLVTPAWWDDIWLNEGFASFVEILAMHQLHPEWENDAQFVVEDLKRGLNSDSIASSHPIYVEVNNPDEVNEIFDTITYSKGSSVLRMLYNSVGDAVFRIGVSSYLKSNNYSNTFHTELYRSLTNEANANGQDIDVGEIMDRWIKQMGYPAVSCLRRGNELILSQQHFLIDPSQSPDSRYPSPYDYTWIIPITMATKDNVTTWNGSQVSHLVQWMRQKTQTFSINSSLEWYLLNLRSTGFYRVNYDLANWEALTSQLIADHSVFTPQDRARLIDDSFALAEAGYIDYGIPLNMTKYLKNETHLAPWVSALGQLLYFYSMLFRQSAEYGLFRAYMRKLVTPIYDRIGIVRRATDSHLTKLAREHIVRAACRYEIGDCKSYAASEFRRYADSNYTSPMDPDIRYTVLCTGIATSNAEVWDHLFNTMIIQTYPGVQYDMIRALACTQEPWLLNRYLMYSLDDSKVRRQDAALVISSVSGNSIGLQILWDFLRSSWANIHSRQTGIFSLSRYISSLSGFNTAERLRELEEFKAKNSDILANAARAVTNVLESVKININWMKKSLPVVTEWLRSQS